MKVTIIGAGLAGLIAANVLRRHNPVVIEQQSSLPHNHFAVLRFRSEEVSNATGIDFEKVTVRKGIWDGKNVCNECTIPMANEYSHNAVGLIESRSCWDLTPTMRWVAPDDFIEQAAQGIDIQLGTPFSRMDHGAGSSEELVISTLPMNVAARMFSLEEITGDSFVNAIRPIYTINVMLKGVNVHQTIYNGSKDHSWYRMTIQGCILKIESSLPTTDCASLVALACFFFGIEGFAPLSSIEQVKLPFGKMSSIDETIRHRTICALTDNFNIYSLGRLATWRPKVLLDSIPGDVAQILQIRQSEYKRKKAKR